MSETTFRPPVEQMGPPTQPELIPHMIDVAQQTGLRSEVFQNEHLLLQEVQGKPAEIDLNNATQIAPNDDPGLIGIIEVGGRALKLYGEASKDGLPPMIMVTSAEHDSKKMMSGDAVKRDFAILQSGQNKQFGREASSAKSLGLDKDNLVSRNHFSLELTAEGKLRINDLNSTNGTKLITAEAGETEKQAEVPYQATAREVGSLALQESIQPPDSKERIIDGTYFKLDGAIASTGREAYAFTTHDKEGNMRRMFVYRSGSEGSLRVSQGIETYQKPDGTYSSRYLKGAEQNSLHQYTQESQLHPKFAQALAEMTGDRDALPLVTDAHLRMSDEQVQATMADFESQIEVSGLADNKLSAEVQKMKANNFSELALTKAFGSKEGKAGKDLDKYIDGLNKQLRKSGVLPDFSRPLRQEFDEHPVMGKITKEVFTHQVNGVNYEWHMASDSIGRVWVDRIRNADSEPTAYGTDKKMVYSGILTSKPLDYKPQTDGLPAEYVKDAGDKNGYYNDITGFLDKLEPIQQYRAKRGVVKR